MFNSEQQSTETTSDLANNATPPEEIAYEIVHAIPGRIRISIPELAIDSEYAEKLKAVLQSDSKIKDARINPKAASIVVKYRAKEISDDQMRSHLINLIQNAPVISDAKPATARSILGAIFDALLALLDSLRNVNKARKGISDGQFKPDTWERLLSGTKGMTKKLKSATMFVLPKRSPKGNKEADSLAISTQSSNATSNETTDNNA